MGRKHLPELDALRGVAAFVVLLNHYHQVWMGTNHPAWISRPRLNPILWFLVNGHASVVLFFLLSGFVLALPSLRGSRQVYPKYAVRRICRIYPPYVAALAVAVLGCTFFWGIKVYGPAVSELWLLRPDRISIIQHLAMIERFDVYRYDAPFWSLVHEMRISLIFPVILFCALRLRIWTTFTLAATCAVAGSLSLLFLETGLPGSVRVTAWSFTLNYCGTFLLGAALAMRYQICVAYVDRLGRVHKAVLLALAAGLYLYPPPAWRGVDLGDFFSACGGLIILAFCLRVHGTFGKVLRMKPMQFLGRISYSLYLLHYPILLTLAYMSFGRIRLELIFLPFVGISLASAALMYRFVEVPSIELGRRLSRF